MSKSIHIVTPIGVGAPGTPVLSLLKKSIQSIKSQTRNDFIFTVASDTDVPDDVKNYLESENVSVKWFEPGYFFRKGSIWRKIVETWKETDTKYLAFLHYDDLWDSRKLELQLDYMEKNNVGCTWSQTYVIDKNDNPVSADLAFWKKFDETTVGRRTTAFAHSSIIERESFFNSGIMKYEMEWGPCFEDLFALYAHFTSGAKVEGARFFWRNHDMNMTNTLCQWTVQGSQWRDEVLKQQTRAGYSDSEVTSDHMKVIEDTKNDYEMFLKKWIL